MLIQIITAKSLFVIIFIIKPLYWDLKMDAYTILPFYSTDLESDKVISANTDVSFGIEMFMLCDRFICEWYPVTSSIDTIVPHLLRPERN